MISLISEFRLHVEKKLLLYSSLISPKKVTILRLKIYSKIENLTKISIFLKNYTKR